MIFSDLFIYPAALGGCGRATKAMSTNKIFY